ncbi:hypothetical protein IC218_04525 [Clostridioides sp. ES-S-0005-03]|uniref:hypothetical protein n=1 Tax=Clostridioides sp. ES-S-0005-03 TaxID=2770774 RepID=UPI001CA578B7|nr:hypothetical protein [Clostridioides sp. ES-S-0005-03]
MTNFEMIKSMSKKELAKFIDTLGGDDCFCDCCKYGVCDYSCSDGYENWLESEVEE